MAGKTVSRPGSWCAPGAIQTVQSLAVPHNGKRVTTQTVAGRLDHRQRHRCGNGSIYRVSACQQHTQPGLCGERLGGADHIAP